MTVTFDKHNTLGSRLFTGYSEKRVAMGIERFSNHIRDQGEIRVLNDATLDYPKRIEKGFFEGGVYEKLWRQTDCDLHRGFGETRQSHTSGPATYSDTAPQTRIEQAWFGGYLFNHFGHFTIEGLARAVSKDVKNSDLPIIFFDMAKIGKLKPYMAEAFQKFGIAASRIVLINETIGVDRLSVQNPAIEIRGAVRPERYKAARENTPLKPRSGLVYLSRSKLVARRKVHGEAAFEQRLAAGFGATVVHPQDHNFKEQLEIFSTASCIVACEGSALHNVIYDGILPTMISLSHSFPSLNYFLCDELVDGQSHYIHAAKESSSIDRNAWEIDSDRVFDYVSDIL